MLDIDLTKLKNINLASINDKVEGYIAHVENGNEMTILPIPLVFSFDFSPQGFGGVVGQLGFFDNFIVQVDRANKSGEAQFEQSYLNLNRLSNAVCITWPVRNCQVHLNIAQDYI